VHALFLAIQFIFIGFEFVDHGPVFRVGIPELLEYAFIIDVGHCQAMGFRAGLFACPASDTHGSVDENGVEFLAIDFFLGSQTLRKKRDSPSHADSL
jgi:hypothetical protein